MGRDTIREYIKALLEEESIEVPNSPEEVVVEEPKRFRKEYPFTGYINFQGIDIDVENVKGSTRKGKDSDGKEWQTYMSAHYGEIRKGGTAGVDEDKLDVYIGDNHNSPLVVIVHQQDPETKEFDEDKIVVGFDSEDEALELYNSQYDSPDYYQDHITMSIGELWSWIKDRENKGKKIEQTS